MPCNLMCVHITFSSVWVAVVTFWERAAHSVKHMFSFFHLVISRLNFLVTNLFPHIPSDVEIAYPWKMLCLTRALYS